MNRLYSLLTGINNYHPDSKVSALHGCHSDIFHWQSFLKKHFPPDRHHSKTLLDGEVTYQNVVDHWGEAFLGQAQPGDTVLFAYSGHGSQEKAALEFDRYYPSGMQETLVLYDSRIPGGLDLADKELAVLIERLAVKGVQVVIVLDCCHSGSATRASADFTFGAVRQHATRPDRRTLTSYLGGAFLDRNNGQGFYLPNSRHILLAACDRTEKAFELTTRQGFFSTCLLHVLEEARGQLAYADLFTRCRMAMSKVSDKQHPQFEPYGFFNSYEAFLGLGGVKQGESLLISFSENTWQANRGAVHGLPIASGLLAQFEVVKDGQVLGLVNSKVVGVETSSLETPPFLMDPAQTYEARLRSLPSPKLAYGLQGTDEQIIAAKQALDAFKPVYFELLENVPQAAYRVEFSTNKIRLIRHADGAELRTIEGNDWTSMYQDAFQKLEHIARWETMVALNNQESRINRSDVQLMLVEMDGQGKVLRTTNHNEVVIDILRVNGIEQKVPFRLEIHNKNKHKSRYCALFHASENYAFRPVGYNELVPGNSTVIAMERSPNGVQYAFELRGKNEEMEILKLYVSNMALSGEAMQQKGFKLGGTICFWKTRSGTMGEKSLRSKRAILGREDDQGITEDPNDWYTITMRVKCVAREASIGASELALAGDFVRIMGHPTLRASVALTSANGGSRSIEPMSMVAELAKDHGVELLTFNAAARDLSSQNILELSDIQNAADVNEAQPLLMDIAANLQVSAESEETLLPVTFDGEHLLPIGLAQRQVNGHALIRITHLPEITDVHRRDLGKALKLCFLKLVLKKKNIHFLQWVDYSGLRPVRRSAELKQRVNSAQNILVLLHGIIGDTRGMCDFARSVVKSDSNPDMPFDLVLTFDYENLNTPIEDTAGRLEQLLREEAGLSPGGGKKITLLAHSMGGLVSRYFIQNLGGQDLVSQLVLVGTPNAGSAISKITTYRDYAIPLLTLLINLPWGIPAAATVLGILQKSKELTVTLAQMDYDHDDWLKNLGKGSLHGVPCNIVAGHLDRYLDRYTDQQKLMDKIYKLGGKLFYGDIPNDLAVSVESIKAVPNVDHILEVPCHHLGYFVEEESVQALMEVLRH